VISITVKKTSLRHQHAHVYCSFGLEVGSMGLMGIFLRSGLILMPLADNS